MWSIGDNKHSSLGLAGPGLANAVLSAFGRKKSWLKLQPTIVSTCGRLFKVKRLPVFGDWRRQERVRGHWVGV